MGVNVKKDNSSNTQCGLLSPIQAVFACYNIGCHLTNPTCENLYFATRVGEMVSNSPDRKVPSSPAGLL